MYEAFRVGEVRETPPAPTARP